MIKAIDRQISDNLGKLKTDVNNLVKIRMEKLSKRIKRITKVLRAQLHAEQDKNDALQIRNKGITLGSHLHIQEKQELKSQLLIERQELELARTLLTKYSINIEKQKKMILNGYKKESNFSKMQEQLEAEIAAAQDEIDKLRSEIDKLRAAIGVANETLLRRSNNSKLRQLRF
jgi:hypothetical protein